MLREISATVFCTMAAIFVVALLSISTSYAQETTSRYSASTQELVTPIVIAEAKKKKFKYTPRRSGSGNLSSGGGGSSKLIPQGGCCATVLGSCVTICNRVGGCTGNSDCATNPN